MIVALVTIAGLVINIIGFKILYPLVFRNQAFNTAGSAPVTAPAVNVEFPPADNNPDDDLRGITAIVNEGFTYSEERVDTNPSSNPSNA